MSVVDAFNVRPADIQPGDEMYFVLKAMVRRDGVYRLYRCRYDGPALQGSPILNQKEVCEALFPSLDMVAKPEGWCDEEDEDEEDEIDSKEWDDE